GPSLAPNSVTTTTFSIGSSCSQCTLHGSAFAFASGNQYSITTVTGRGTIFTFTVDLSSGHHYFVDLQEGFGSTAYQPKGSVKWLFLRVDSSEAESDHWNGSPQPRSRFVSHRIRCRDSSLVVEVFSYPDGTVRIRAESTPSTVNT